MPSHYTLDDADGSADSPAAGRWSDEEHARFMEGLHMYGRDWKAISELVRAGGMRAPAWRAVARPEDARRLRVDLAAAFHFVDACR